MTGSDDRGPAPQDSGAPRPPAPPPKLSPGFMLLWILGLLVFLGGVGCTLMLSAFALESGGHLGGWLGLLVMIGALVWFYRSLARGRQAERAQAPPNQVLKFMLLLPVLAGFVWAGGCLLSIGALS